MTYNQRQTFAEYDNSRMVALDNELQCSWCNWLNPLQFLAWKIDLVEIAHNLRQSLQRVWLIRKRQEYHILRFEASLLLHIFDRQLTILRPIFCAHLSEGKFLHRMYHLSIRHQHLCFLNIGNIYRWLHSQPVWVIKSRRFQHTHHWVLMIITIAQFYTHLSSVNAVNVGAISPLKWNFSILIYFFQ